MKKIMVTMSALMLTGALTACNADNNGMNTQGNNDTRPIGYYTNDNNRNQDDAGEGPITDMMDNDDRVGQNRNQGRNNGNGMGIANQGNNTNRIGVNDTRNNNNLGRNNGLGTNNNTNMNYADGYDGDLAQRISNRVNKVDNVEDARVIIGDEHVLIGVQTDNGNGNRNNNGNNGNNNANQDMEREIRSAVKGMTDKDVRVTTDEDNFGRITNIDDDLRGGQAFEEVQDDFEGIFEDLGNAIQRPFQNNR
jgi:spore cortex protein